MYLNRISLAGDTAFCGSVRVFTMSFVIVSRTLPSLGPRMASKAETGLMPSVRARMMRNHLAARFAARPSIDAAKCLGAGDAE